MAKRSYRIPVGINRSYLDHEMSIGRGDVIPPITLGQLGFMIAGFFVVVWVVMASPLSAASFGWKALFVVWGALTVLYLGSPTRTKELKIANVLPLLSYLPASARKVMTRRSSDPSHFGQIVGIEKIAEDGRITFADGSVGQTYTIVGSASYLLFDQDREDILDHVDAFWRKVDTNCEWIWITTKEPQRVDYQVATLEQRNLALEVRDPDLVALLQEQYDILAEHVGGRYSSIHQRLILKGKNPDALRRGHLILQAEVEGSALMMKEATMLDREETEAVLKVFYQGVTNARQDELADMARAN